MKKIASRLLKTIILAIFVFPSIHPGRMGIGNYFMNTNVDLFHDSTKNSIDKRENTIRTGNIDFKIIAFVGRDIENELHSKFEIKRMEREWFHLSDNDIDNIINEYGFIRVRNSVKDKKI